MFLNLQFTDEETEFHEHSRLALDHVSHPRQNRNWNLYQLLGTLCHIPGWRRALSLTEQLPLSWYCRLFWNAACYWAELRLHYRPSCSIFGLRRTRNWVHPSFPKRVVSAFYVVRFLFKKKNENFVNNIQTLKHTSLTIFHLYSIAFFLNPGGLDSENTSVRLQFSVSSHPHPIHMAQQPIVCSPSGRPPYKQGIGWIADRVVSQVLVLHTVFSQPVQF